MTGARAPLRRRLSRSPSLTQGNDRSQTCFPDPWSASRFESMSAGLPQGLDRKAGCIHPRRGRRSRRRRPAPGRDSRSAARPARRHSADLRALPRAATGSTGQPARSIQGIGMMRIIAAAAVSLALISAAGSPSAAQPPPCSDWNTRQFFHDAGPDDVARCLAAGAAPDARAEFALTPLHFAAMHSRPAAVIALLVKAGGGLEARTVEGWTPLHAAVRYGRTPRMVAALLNAGADPDGAQPQGLDAPAPRGALSPRAAGGHGPAAGRSGPERAGRRRQDAAPRRRRPTAMRPGWSRFC